VLAALRPWRHRTHDFLLAALVRATLIVLRLLPLSLALPLSRALAFMVFCLSTRDRSRAIAQLQEMLELTPTQARRTAREVFERIGEGVIELLHLPVRDPGLERSVRVEGLHHLTAALEQGKGAIWMTGHLGNWELMAMKMAALGVPFQVVARRVNYPRLDRMLTAFRERHGVHALMRGEDTSPASLARTLSAGHVLGILVDQATRVPGLPIPFFGRAAHTPSGAARLALHTGAPVLIGRIERVRPLEHVIWIGAPLELPEAASCEARIALLLERVNHHLEGAVRADPASWPWFHARWKPVRWR